MFAFLKTRLHSSRMRTARSLPVSPSMHYGGGKGGYLPRGCTCPGGGTCRGRRYLSGGCTCRGNWYLSGGCTLPRGYVPLVLGCRQGYLPRYPPPVNRMTDRCKNITLPQASFAGGKNRSNGNKTQTQRMGSIPILCVNVKQANAETNVNIDV